MAKTITVITETNGKYLRVFNGVSVEVVLFYPEVNGSDSATGVFSFREGNMQVSTINVIDYIVGTGNVGDPIIQKFTDIEKLCLDVRASVAGMVTVSNFPATQNVAIVGSVALPVNTGQSQPLTDAQLRANAVPVSVSGTVNTGLSQSLTDTQLRASNVNVNNKFDYGTDRTADNGASVNFTTIGTKYAVLGLQLGSDVNLMGLTALNTNEKYMLEIVKLPTVAGTFTYSAIANSNCSQAIGAVANTVTGGTTIYRNLVNGNSSFEFDLKFLNKLTNAGTDKYVVCITPITAGVNLRVVLNFKESV